MQKTQVTLKTLKSKAQNRRELNPPLRFWTGADGRLWTQVDDKKMPVRAVPCFPWSRPGEFVSLRNDEDHEVAFVRSLDDLEQTSRQLLEKALHETGFVMTVEKVLDRREEFEVRIWEVQTQNGFRIFQTKRDQWPIQMENGGLLIRDIAGDLYFIPHADQLDKTSRKHIEAFID